MVPRGEDRSASQTLDSIAGEIRLCRLCPLATGRTHAVPGEGPARAGILLVGEGPGKSEDLEGRPFVGRGGRLLDSSLGSMGLSRKDTFITNVVKCRPPGNRIPTADEVETCVGRYLHRQLAAVDPSVVVLLGRTAAKAVLGARTLREIRGKLRRKGDRTYLCTYHPAAVLRNPHLKRTFVADLRKVTAINERNS